MNKDNICDFIEENQHEDDKDTVLIDNQETAFIGYIRTYEGMSAVYSYSKIIDNLMSDNMTYEEATEYFDYNIDRGIDYITEGIKPTILYPYSS